MSIYSRRDFLYQSAKSIFTFQIPCYAFQKRNNKLISTYPGTVKVLQEAFHFEMIAHKRYIEYIQKALVDVFPDNMTVQTSGTRVVPGISWSPPGEYNVQLWIFRKG